MPNHVTNFLSFENVPYERVKEILEAIKNDEIGIGSIDFNKIIPMPEHIFRGNLGSEELEKYGTDNWYDWSISNWGTKWNSYEPAPFDGGDTIEFFTAWSAPHPILEQLSKQFPDVLLYHRWCDEDFGYNVGEREHQNGEIVYENIPVGGSKEAYEMAASISGYNLEELGYRLSKDGSTYEYVEDEIENTDQKIKVVLVKPKEKAVITEIGADLKSMQEAVGGMIQAVYPFDEQIAIVCNDEGKILELPLNRALKTTDGEIIDIIAGDFFICDCSGENFGSLSDEQLSRYSEMFKYPERFYRDDGEIKAVSIRDNKDKGFER